MTILILLLEIIIDFKLVWRLVQRVSCCWNTFNIFFCQFYLQTIFRIGIEWLERGHRPLRIEINNISIRMYRSKCIFNLATPILKNSEFACLKWIMVVSYLFSYFVPIWVFEILIFQWRNLINVQSLHRLMLFQTHLWPRFCLVYVSLVSLAGCLVCKEVLILA